jgi:hypothetical protein
LSEGARLTDEIKRADGRDKNLHVLSQSRHIQLNKTIERDGGQQPPTSPNMKRRKAGKSLQDTKQERSLMNYQRYLKLWDQHEGEVKEFFDKQYKDERSDASVTLNRRRMYKQHPAEVKSAALDHLDIRGDPAAADAQDEAYHKRLQRMNRALKIISLAKSMVLPRTDTASSKLRLSDTMMSSVNLDGFSSQVTHQSKVANFLREKADTMPLTGFLGDGKAIDEEPEIAEKARRSL